MVCPPRLGDRIPPGRGAPRVPRVFFFSSRRRHTRFDCDWSSDVCSSDLADGQSLVVRWLVFVFARAVVYATLFIGFLLVFLPARIVAWSGMTPPAQLGALQDRKSVV